MKWLAWLLALAALATGSLAAAAQPGRVEFAVFRNGAPSGSHSVQVTQTPDGVSARVAIDIAGRVGPFAYGYTHRCEERWRDGELVALACVDRERGKPEARVEASREGAGLKVQGPKFTGAAPGDVLPSSWWRKSLVEGDSYLDTRTGEVMAMRATRVGVETVEAGGASVRATRYRVEGSSTADIWYDDSGRWVRMAFRLRGQNFEYRLTSPVAEAPRG